MSGTAYPSRAPKFTHVFCVVRVAQSLVFCIVFCRSLVSLLVTFCWQLYYLSLPSSHYLFHILFFQHYVGYLNNFIGGGNWSAPQKNPEYAEKTKKQVAFPCSVLEMKIWSYWSDSNFWIYFYIVLNKLKNLLVLGQRTGIHREDCY